MFVVRALGKGILQYLSNLYCLTGRAGGSPNRLGHAAFLILEQASRENRGRFPISLDFKRGDEHAEVGSQGSTHRKA
jgi:hypothetical protein